jgi:beta-phosphoglucomutase
MWSSMHWIHDFRLFLFDFDGLLVNTEEIHFLAYKKMCADRGFNLPWNFDHYCMMAHYESDKLKKQIYADLPDLYRMEPRWEVLYAEKKQNMINLLKEGAVHLMPGAETLLRAIADTAICRCVVTNSPIEQIELIKEKNPILNTIPYWFTRETYKEPKPNPECYLNAIEKTGIKENIIGFEDTPRGMRALLHTQAKPVLISEVKYPEIGDFIKQGVLYYPSLLQLPENQLT